MRSTPTLTALALLILVLVVIFSVDAVFTKKYETVSIPDIITNEKEVIRMIESLGLSATMRKVSRDPAYHRDDTACHGAAHVVGQAAFSLLGIGALEQCTTECFSGCYHGALQKMGKQNTARIDELAADLEPLCVARATTFERSECFHGAGHGFLLYERYDLDAALGACRLFSSADDTYPCYMGVFMENLVGEGSESRFVKDDPHYPCNEYGADPAAQEACYRMQPTIFLLAHGEDLSLAQEECLDAPEHARPACFKRFGQLSGADTEDPPKMTEAFCATVPEEYYDECIRGGLRQVIRVNGIDSSGTAASFCRELEGASAKHICYEDYASQLPDLFNGREERLALCALFEAPYDESCRERQ